MIACNSSCTYFATKKACFAIGNRESGLLGFENTGYLFNHPVPIDLSFNIQIEGVTANKKHVIVWDTNGVGYGWGCNSHGQLGIQDNIKKTGKFIKKPERIIFLSKKKIISALAGIDSSFVITNKGKIYFWGLPVKHLDGRGKVYDSVTQ
jgi:alpha-tubulin suppressor-like RCC1 family protein